MPLQIGDLVEYQSERWFVERRHTGVRTVTLRQLDGRAVEVPNDIDSSECRVIAHLPTQWPFVAAPKQRYPVEAITFIRGQRFALKPMYAWVPGDPLHGGVLYFHPLLNLRPEEVLIARHTNGALSKLTITKSFGTVQSRVAREEARRSPPAPTTRYEHLLLDDEDDA